MERGIRRRVAHLRRQEVVFHDVLSRQGWPSRRALAQEQDRYNQSDQALDNSASHEASFSCGENMNCGLIVRMSDANTVSVAVELTNIANAMRKPIQKCMRNPHDNIKTPNPAATAVVTKTVAFPAERNARRTATVSGR